MTAAGLQPRLKVHAWSGKALFAAALPGMRRDLIVIAVRTPPGGLREAARADVRTAASLALGLWCGCAPDDVVLESAPGQPVTAQVAGRAIGISLAHEPGVHAASPGLSLVALHRDGPVGVDVLRGDAQFDSTGVAELYLGPLARARIAASATPLRPLTFAREWARMEAGYKSQGIGLAEWTPALETTLQASDYLELDGLPPPFVAALAIPRP